MRNQSLHDSLTRILNDTLASSEHESNKGKKTKKENLKEARELVDKMASFAISACSTAPESVDSSIFHYMKS